MLPQSAIDDYLYHIRIALLRKITELARNDVERQALASIAQDFYEAALNYVMPLGQQELRRSHLR